MIHDTEMHYWYLRLRCWYSVLRTLYPETLNDSGPGNFFRPSRDQCPSSSKAIGVSAIASILLEPEARSSGHMLDAG